MGSLGEPDVAKHILWFQKLVTASLVMSLLSTCQLIILTSTCFSKLRLQSASKRILSIKLKFRMQKGDLGTFLSTELAALCEGKVVLQQVNFIN